MSKTNHITIVLSNDQIKTFSKLIERLTGETYNNIEVIKSESI